jgi:hypothetical protein
MATVVLNLKNLNKKIAALPIVFGAQGMGVIGARVQDLNQDQINKQIDKEGRRVKSYNPEYAEAKGERKVTYVSRKLKTKSGRTRKGQRSRGHMMTSFGVVRRRRGEVIVGFRSASAKLKATWNFRLREFIGLTTRNKRKLFKFIVQRLDYYS